MIRQAVVLAADAGSVARERVAGLTMLERTVHTLTRAGIDRILVTGTADLQPLVDALDSTAAVSLLKTSAEDPSGLRAVREHLTGAFLLARVDRIVDVAIVKRAVAADLSAADLWDAGDAGIVAAGPTLVTELAEGSLAEAIERLREQGRVRGIDLGDAPCHRADTAEARRAAEDALFRALRKRTDGPVSRYLNRPMSLFVTRLLVNTSITPNQMTIVANLIGALGVWFVFQGTWTTLAVGGALVHLQSVLDGCDGEMARLKFKSSRIGEWLDNVLDDQVNIGYGIALGFAATALTGQELWRWIGLGAGAAFFLHNAAFYWQLAFVHRSGNPFLFRWWFEKPGVDVTAMLAAPTFGKRLGAAVRSLIRRDLFLFAFMLLCFVRLPQIAALWYAAVAASQFIVMALHLIKGGAPAASRAVAVRSY